MIFSRNGINPNFFEVSEQTNHNFPVHCHYSLEIVLALSGNILIEKSGRVYSLEKGDVIVIMPLETHNCITPKNSQIIYIQFSPRLISNWDMLFGNKTLKNSLCKLSHEETKELSEEMKKADGSVININYLFFKVMNKFMENNELVVNSKRDNICLDALIYMSENFNRDIKLKDVASALSVSYVYLSRVFAKKMNFRFVDCLNSFRIQEAVSLVSNPEKSIGEISYECGFGSVRQFNRCFVQMMKCTPSEYRTRVLRNLILKH